MGEWISVSERLPGKSDPVLLWCPPEDDEDTWLTYCDIGRYSRTTNGNHWFDTDDGGALPTHWQPLPPPPPAR